MPRRAERPVGEGPDAARDRWRETVRAKALKGAAERRETFETSSGIEIRDLYTPADTADLDEDRDLGRPGEFPFTRGVQPTMYRGRFWTMRQYAGFATAEETERILRWLESPGIRLVEVDGEWTCPVGGATRHLALHDAVHQSRLDLVPFDERRELPVASRPAR